MPGATAQVLTFLNKNALTITPQPKAAETTTPKYSRLQFVAPGASKPSAKAATSPSSTSQEQSDTAVSNLTPPPLQQTPTATTFPANPQQPPEPPNPKPPLLQHLDPSLNDNNLPPLAQWRPQSIGHDSLASPVRNLDITGKLAGASPNNDAAYETALNVLLSLGNEGTGLSQGSEPDPAPFPMGNDGMVLSPGELMAMSPNSTRERRGSSTTHAPAAVGISQDRVLQLLRHFRYQVAPWLDLCDMSQTFGLYVPRLAIESEGVLHSLLAVAAAAQQADSRAMFNDVGYLKSLAETRSALTDGTSHIGDGDLAHLALSAACRLISSIPDGWTDRPAMVDERFWSMALSEATPKTISILSVLIRFELAASLVTGSPLFVPEHLNSNPISQEWNSSAIAESMFQCTMEPLLLCTKVINFCAGSFPPQNAEFGPPVTPLHHWTLLNDALGSWYSSRAQEFRPMVEIDGDESLFPVILFTNGAAVLANQLYHTAMLLLLQNKPRTLQAAAKKSSSMSPLWHAQRVCGIALNNDRRDSWDLCLVASLYLAAQRMTYEPQQRAIMECFDRVKMLTGWNVDGFSIRVREDWGIM
ncbi:hypothetical protein CCHL11_07913 [Colletotrichum chlorophyti]|uniref:Uncharacterized protein n=1 Tax=Colletotrichum chlorophyti TaxID=708187 RepID=A0A1Q8S8M0_9PEZI|nr:hypothetical protein CCHL11_07913 [Colletotrichum chlorophyti]